VVSRNFVAARHSFRKRVSGCIKARVFATGTISSFFATNMPTKLLKVQNSCFGWFRAISLPHVTHSENGCRGDKRTSFCLRNHFFVFRNEHAQYTTLGPKLMFGVVSRNFVAARHPFRKRVSGCIKARVFATGTISSFFATNMPNPLLKVQNSCLGWFRAILLPHVTHSENRCRGAYNARVFATETISSFFATNKPNPLL
jgi:hypothetical protein